MEKEKERFDVNDVERKEKRGSKVVTGEIFRDTLAPTQKAPSNQT